MKNIFFSVLCLLSLLFLVANVSEAAMGCGAVNGKAASCLAFATGKATAPGKACCTGLQKLAKAAKTVDDRKAVCRCLKDSVKSVGGVQEKYLKQIPEVCKINVGFAISLNINCDRVR